jgi:hypothetical protein
MGKGGAAPFEGAGLRLGGVLRRLIPLINKQTLKVWQLYCSLYPEGGGGGPESLHPFPLIGLSGSSHTAMTHVLALVLYIQVWLLLRYWDCMEQQPTIGT